MVDEAKYRIARRSYSKKLPPVDPTLQNSLDELKRQGLTIRSLDDLPFEANSNLKQVLPEVAAYLNQLQTTEDMGYESGFSHCVPIPPKDSALKFPQLFFWGLDEQLLNFVENMVGLPIAYHGVVARQEIIDGQVSGSRRWHIDSEDREIIRIMIYLSDVLEDDDGPFEYIPMTKSPGYGDFNGIDLDFIPDQAMDNLVSKSEWKKVLGPSGTVLFLRPGKMFHRGSMPKTPRQAISYYYTSRNPTNRELTLENSFRSGIPYISDEGLNPRHLECLWEYKSQLGSAL